MRSPSASILTVSPSRVTFGSLVKPVRVENFQRPPVLAELKKPLVEDFAPAERFHVQGIETLEPERMGAGLDHQGGRALFWYPWLPPERNLWYPEIATERAIEMSRAARIPQIDAPSSFVDRIREHVERDEVGAARRVLAEALQAGSTEPRLANWEKLLAPGKVLGSIPVRDSDRSAELSWLAEHGKEYRREWVAVLGAQLLAHAKSYAELRAELDRLKSASPPLVHFIQ